MSNVIKPGTRVLTVYGWGTIINFERVPHINSPIVHATEYAEGDRIGVKLDNPTNWACHSETSGNPYFLLSDLLDWEY